VGGRIDREQPDGVDREWRAMRVRAVPVSTTKSSIGLYFPVIGGPETSIDPGGRRRATGRQRRPIGIRPLDQFEPDGVRLSSSRRIGPPVTAWPYS
jgi:hypothetical protein